MKTKGELEYLKIRIFTNIEDDIETKYGLFSQGYDNGYMQCQEDMADTSKVTRFEVIDENGRAYTQKDCKVELSYQDDGRTLKVFINSLNKQD